MADGFGTDTAVFGCTSAACITFHFLLVRIRMRVNACPCDVHEMYAIDNAVDSAEMENTDMMTTTEGEAFSPPSPIGRMKHVEALMGACRWPLTVIAYVAVGTWALNQTKVFGEPMSAMAISTGVTPSLIMPSGNTTTTASAASNTTTPAVSGTVVAPGTNSSSFAATTVAFGYSYWYQTALDVHAYLCIAVALWLTTMLLITQRVLWKQLHLRSLQQRLADDVDIHDPQLYQFASRREWFIKIISKEVPEVDASFDFARYQALCLDHALIRMRDFKIRSIVASIVALSLIGFVDILAWDFSDIWRHATVLVVTITFTLALYFHVHNEEKEMNSIVGVNTAPHLDSIDEDAGSLPMVFTKASIVCSSYMVVRLFSSRVLNSESGLRTGKSASTGEEAGIIVMHVVAFLLQCIVQSEVVLASTTLLSMPPRVNSKHVNIATMVAGMAGRDVAGSQSPLWHQERQPQDSGTYTWKVKPGTEAPMAVAPPTIESEEPPASVVEPAPGTPDRLTSQPEASEASTTGTPALPVSEGTTASPPERKASAAPSTKFKDLLAKRTKLKSDADAGGKQGQTIALGADGQVDVDDLFRTLATRRKARQDNPPAAPIPMPTV